MNGITWRTCKCSLSNLLPQWRTFSTTKSKCHQKTAARRNSHYSALGITPKATQAEVKAAYYKLSKIYHPDRQFEGKDIAENAQKFRELTAAYEVLGNVKLRRLYDKGVHNIGGNVTSPADWRRPSVDVDDDPKMKFYRSREVRSHPPPPVYGTPVYDFNEWSKQHYGATFMRDQNIKHNRARRAAAATSKINDVKIERVLLAMSVMIFMGALLAADIRSHDETVYRRDDENRSTANIKKS